MAENNPYAEYASTQLYQDASGKGAVIGTVPVGNNAQGNMSSLSPGAKKKTKKEQEPQQEDVDYLESLFDGENLSEDFKFKAKTIFEAAINERVSMIEAHILEAAKELVQEQSEAAKEVVAESTANTANNLVEHIDGYLNYVVEEWVEENQVAIERGLRTELAENFINQLKDLFESSFIDVPDEKYNILDDMYGANSELQEALNSTIAENMQLRNEITARLCAEAFIEQTSDLADTEIEKLASLAEGIEFDSVDQYKQKVAILKETYFNGNSSVLAESSNRTYLNENVGSFVSTESSNNIMDSVVGAISAMQRNKPKATQNAEKLTSLINPGIVQDNFI